jgi:hypothetical protein
MRRAAWAALAAALLARAQPEKLRFQPSGDEFVFDTGLLKGKLRAGGRSLGLCSVVHVPSGAQISRSMGLFGHYRVFSANRRYGDAAWNWPSQARLLPDGAVEVYWPAAEGRPLRLWAVYRWSGAGELDLETGAESDAELPGFESFLASYFSEDFKISRAYAGSPPAWLPADPAHGVWQMFPRDPQALALIQDGRWSYPPSPVNWALRPVLAQPIGLRRAPALDLTAVVMAPREECFAVASPHQTEGHYSIYLSLFGGTLSPGRRQRARARLVIAGSLEERRIPELYRAYLAAIEGR